MNKYHWPDLDRVCEYISDVQGIEILDSVEAVVFRLNGFLGEVLFVAASGHASFILRKNGEIVGGFWDLKGLKPIITKCFSA